MTDERDIHKDEALSDAYRRLASEKAPEALNDAVLREAAKAAKPSLARSIGWTRPLAWAATIALTLAISMQITQTPDPTLALDPMPASVEPASQPAAAAELEEKIKVQEKPAANQRVMSDAPVDALKEEAPAPIRQRSNSPAADVAAAAAPAEARMDTAELRAEDSVADQFSADTEILERAEALASERSGSSDAEVFVMEDEADADDASGVASYSSALVVTPQAKRSFESAATGCTAEQHESAVAWLICISNMESADLLAEAEMQRQQLQKAFPAAASASCTVSDRQLAESWRSCIQALDDAGLGDAAAFERERLSLAFPDANPD